MTIGHPRSGSTALTDLLAGPGALCRLHGAAMDPGVFTGPEMLAAASGRILPNDWVAVLVPDPNEPGELDAALIVRHARAVPLVGPAVMEAWSTHYGPTTPPLLRSGVPNAAGRLLETLGNVGGVVRLRHQPLDNPAVTALLAASEAAGCKAIVLDAHERACLDATLTAEQAFGPALMGRRLKELRRQWRRLEQTAPTVHRVEREPETVLAALDALASLEATGWKRRSGLAAQATHLDFARRFVASLAAVGQARADVIDHAGRPVAVLVTLLCGRTAYIWKVAHDANLAAASPGAQVIRLASEAFLADDRIDQVDSLATENHPLIDRFWTGRARIGTVVLATRPGSEKAARRTSAWHRREAEARAFARRLIRRIRRPG